MTVAGWIRPNCAWRWTRSALTHGRRRRRPVPADGLSAMSRIERALGEKGSIPDNHRVESSNAAAAFKLVVHHGEGAAFPAMDWRSGRPPDDFVGFAIEHREPEGDRCFGLRNMNKCLHRRT